MLAPAAQARAGHVLETVARGLAYVGGLVLVAIAIITVLSITGRALISVGLGPIKGDFEMVEIGCAIAVFFFLPWCQLKRGHVTVDILVDRMPRRAHAGFGLIGDLCVLLASVIIAWRLYLGFGEKFPFGSDALRATLSMGYKPFFPETTYELEVPIWIPYGFALIGAVIFVLVSLYTVWRSLNWTLAGQEGRP